MAYVTEGKIRRMTADDWQLYGMPGAENAATQITAEMQAVLEQVGPNVGGGMTIKEAGMTAAGEGQVILAKFREFGAEDTEPRGVMIRIIEQFLSKRFGTDGDFARDY